MTEPDRPVRLSPLAKTRHLPAKPRAVIMGAVPVAAAVVGAGLAVQYSRTVEAPGNERAPVAPSPSVPTSSVRSQATPFFGGGDPCDGTHQRRRWNRGTITGSAKRWRAGWDGAGRVSQASRRWRRPGGSLAVTYGRGDQLVRGRISGPAACASTGSCR